MHRSRRAAVVALIVLTVQSAIADEAYDRRIRTTDPRLRRLIAAGARASPTFRALVERIEASDVVVYVMCDSAPPARVAGRLTFVSAVAGFRYVAVRLARLEPDAHQIAILGHELQHAAEVADDPSIVDVPSLARAYTRIGRVNRTAGTAGVAFDTDAAIAAGRSVLGELAGDSSH